MTTGPACSEYVDGCSDCAKWEAGRLDRAEQEVRRLTLIVEQLHSALSYARVPVICQETATVGRVADLALPGGEC